MYKLLNRLKELGVNAVILNHTVFIVGHHGELLLASDVLLKLSTINQR